MTIEEEARLIARAKTGDWQAFETLYDLHKSSIYRTAVVITGDRMTAEEILQETFLRAFKHIHRIHEGVSLAPWLYRIAVNLAYDLTARQKRGLKMINHLVERLLHAPSGLTPEQKIEEQELQSIIYESINQLEFKQRATLVLFYLQDFNLNEIAEIMDCPAGTVKSRLYYARENLRRKLLADKRLSGRVMYAFSKTEAT